jgi:mono/diheme cytochrome c family protein
MKLKTKFVILLPTIFAAALLGFWFVWLKFLRTEPEPDWVVSDPVQRFKYGSVGAEVTYGMPYWIWEVLPRIFSDLTPGPGGYKSFGLAWEEGKEMPVGLTKRVVGYPRVAANCALCHVGTWRSKEQEVPHLILGTPANTVNVQALRRFFADAANDSRFNASVLLAEVKRDVKLSFLDQQIYRFILIPRTRKALARFSLADSPGCPKSLPGLHRVQELNQFLGGLRPPEFPFPIDRDLASKGMVIYERACADCHRPGGAQLGKPISGIRTDTNLIAVWKQVLADQANSTAKRLGLNRSGNARNSGYQAPSLNGLWTRAPYLHDGSVPTLLDLLTFPDKRPVRFYRGFDVYDPIKVGFVSEGPDAEREGSLMEVNRPGNNDNGGHTYGTDLPESDTKALLEFLKTL